MIGSRAAGLLRNISRNPVNQNFLTTSRQQVRQHSTEKELTWAYRTANPPPAWAVNGGTFCSVVCWWWFYWNLYHGWPHLIGLYNGEFLPNPRNDYTDQELGIPPDDA